jgi:hypothetical protein
MHTYLLPPKKIINEFPLQWSWQMTFRVRTFAPIKRATPLHSLYSKNPSLESASGTSWLALVSDILLTGEDLHNTLGRSVLRPGADRMGQLEQPGQSTVPEGTWITSPNFIVRGSYTSLIFLNKWNLLTLACSTSMLLTASSYPGCIPMIPFNISYLLEQCWI